MPLQRLLERNPPRINPANVLQYPASSSSKTLITSGMRASPIFEG
jgi:hypothetical protein